MPALPRHNESMPDSVRASALNATPALSCPACPHFACLLLALPAPPFPSRPYPFALGRASPAPATPSRSQPCPRPACQLGSLVQHLQLLVAEPGPHLRKGPGQPGLIALCQFIQCSLLALGELIGGLFVPVLVTAPA